MTPQEKFNLFVDMATDMAIKIRNSDITVTKCGSVVYLLYGKVKSLQSLNVKFGNEFEDLLNEFYRKCGYNLPHNRNHMIGEHQIDTLIIEEEFVYYREQKANINLDSEKIKSTVQKVLNVVSDLKNDNENKDIKYHVHNTTVWEENDALHDKSKYKELRKNGIEVFFMKDYFKFMAKHYYCKCQCICGTAPPGIIASIVTPT